MTQTLERTARDTAEVNHELEPTVGEIVDTMKELEELEGGNPALRDELQLEVEEKIEELVRNPVESFASDVRYMAELYENRSVIRTLPDGSSLQTWGTHDRSKLFLDFTYSVLSRPDGTTRYDVTWTHEAGKTAYRLDQDELDVTMIPRQNPTLGSTLRHSPRSLEGDEMDSAIRVMFDSSTAAAATAKVRAPELQTKIHTSAMYLLPESSLGSVTTKAHDAESLETQLNRYHTR